MTYHRAMRDIIDLLESINAEQLDEAGAGPARVLQHIRSGEVFLMLSAMRGNLKHAENLRRTEKLRQMLARLPVTFIETEGEYQEDGRDTPSPEKSFFVMPRRGSERANPETFRSFGGKLMHAFDQDSILYGDGHTATLLFADGGSFDLGDTATFRPEVINKLDGFSKIKGRKFSFTSAEKAAEPVQGPDGTEPAKTTGIAYGGDKKARAA